MNSREDGVRAYHEGDEREINRAWNCERDTERTLDEWSWRFPAATGGRTVMVGLRGGRIAAHCGGAPISIHAGGKGHRAVIVQELFADPGSGGDDSILEQTLGAFLDRARAGGLAVLAIDRGTAGRGSDVFHSSQWTPVAAEVECLVREARPKSPIRRLLYRAELARDWEPRLDGLWERARGAYPLAVVRDANLAIGQRAGHPRLRFHRFLVFPRFGRHAVAWVVFESGSGVCRWMDLVWDHSHPGALEMAAHLSARYCVQMGVGVEKIALGGDPRAVQRLCRLGFGRDPDDDVAVRAFVSEPGEGPWEVDRPLYLTELELDRV